MHEGQSVLLGGARPQYPRLVFSLPPLTSFKKKRRRKLNPDRGVQKLGF
jgi:hypothetical protein